MIIGKWKYRKQEPSDVRGLCTRCNEKPQKKVAGKDKYRPLCSTCDWIIHDKKTKRGGGKKLKKNFLPKLPKSYRQFKKDSCEFCGFKAVDSCQLDVDHIDGNSSNHHPDNLQTLCSNCHRLKTKLNKDGPYSKMKE